MREKTLIGTSLGLFRQVESRLDGNSRAMFRLFVGKTRTVSLGFRTLLQNVEKNEMTNNFHCFYCKTYLFL